MTLEPRTAIAAGALALLSSAAGSPPTPHGEHRPGQGLSFEELARDFCEKNGIASDEPPEVDDLLDGPLFVRISLGGLDVRCPASILSDGDQAKLLMRAAAVLVRVQATWIDWKDAGRDDHAQAAEDFEALGDWVGRWSPRALSKVDPTEAGSLHEALKTKKKTLEAIARLEERMRPDEDTVFDLGENLHRLVLSPSREHFLGLVGFCGLVDYDERGADEEGRRWPDRPRRGSAGRSSSASRCPSGPSTRPGPSPAARSTSGGPPRWNRPRRTARPRSSSARASTRPGCTSSRPPS